MKKEIRIGCIMGLVLLCLCACGQNSEIYLEEYEETTLKAEEVTTGQLSVSEAEESESAANKSICYVYICGAVERPGVYALPEGSRIYEVVEKAGGLSEEADTTAVNQAELVTDGMMIRIYTKDEIKMSETESGNGNDENSAEDGRVNINTAGMAELMTLPGIGSAKAEAIISYRETQGVFSSIEELMKVPGIKEGIFQQMKEHVKVNK